MIDRVNHGAACGLCVVVRYGPFPNALAFLSVRPIDMIGTMREQNCAVTTTQFRPYPSYREVPRWGENE